MKSLVAAVAPLAFASIATPAIAYTTVITTSVEVENGASEAELQTAVKSAVTDVLKRAIVFSPTIVTVEKATVVRRPRNLPIHGEICSYARRSEGGLRCRNEL